MGLDDHDLKRLQEELLADPKVGAVIVLGCIIYSLFSASPPSVATGVSAVSQVWTYIGEVLFNMLVLVGTIKLSDRVVKDMMGL